jgi:hypothetical protein
MSQSNIFDESIDKRENKKPANSSIRFLAQINSPELLSIEPKKLDSFFKNQLQDTNL